MAPESTFLSPSICQEFKRESDGEIVRRTIDVKGNVTTFPIEDYGGSFKRGPAIETEPRLDPDEYQALLGCANAERRIVASTAN